MTPWVCERHNYRTVGLIVVADESLCDRKHGQDCADQEQSLPENEVFDRTHAAAAARCRFYEPEYLKTSEDQPELPPLTSRRSPAHRPLLRLSLPCPL